MRDEMWSQCGAEGEAGIPASGREDLWAVRLIPILVWAEKAPRTGLEDSKVSSNSNGRQSHPQEEISPCFTLCSVLHGRQRRIHPLLQLRMDGEANAPADI